MRCAVKWDSVILSGRQTNPNHTIRPQVFGLFTNFASVWKSRIDGWTFWLPQKTAPQNCQWSHKALHFGPGLVLRRCGQSCSANETIKLLRHNCINDCWFCSFRLSVQDSLELHVVHFWFNGYEVLKDKTRLIADHTTLHCTQADLSLYLKRTCENSDMIKFWM